MPINLLVI